MWEPVAIKIEFTFPNDKDSYKLIRIIYYANYYEYSRPQFGGRWEKRIRMDYVNDYVNLSELDIPWGRFTKRQFTGKDRVILRSLLLDLVDYFKELKEDNVVKILGETLEKL
jgi:hypothetical protein